VLQGNCTDDVAAHHIASTLQLEGPNLLPLKQNQCLLVVGHDTLDLQASNLWLDNIYFRVRSNSTATLLSVRSAAQLWATNVTFQGHNSPSCQALQATDAKGVYASGVLFPKRGALNEYSVIPVSQLKFKKTWIWIQRIPVMWCSNSETCTPM
jgi:hypothetical protein